MESSSDFALFIFSIILFVEISGKIIEKASGGKPSGRSVRGSSLKTRNLVTDFEVFKRIVFTSSEIRRILSDGISYSDKQIPFSLRYSKSCGSSSPQPANLSNSDVALEIWSNNSFFLSTISRTRLAFCKASSFETVSYLKVFLSVFTSDKSIEALNKVSDTFL